jgi:hypothetical protein
LDFSARDEFDEDIVHWSIGLKVDRNRHTRTMRKVKARDVHSAQPMRDNPRRNTTSIGCTSLAGGPSKSARRGGLRSRQLIGLSYGWGFLMALLVWFFHLTLHARVPAFSRAVRLVRWCSHPTRSARRRRRLAA